MPTRTAVKLDIMPSLGVFDANCIVGSLALAKNFSVTDSSDTTAEIYLGGMIPWRLTNQSGSSRTFTIQDAVERDGEVATPEDRDGVDSSTYVVGDGESIELTGLAGCTYLVITGDAAADNVSLTCMR